MGTRRTPRAPLRAALALLALSWLAASPAAAPAQDAGSPNLAIIDVQQVLRESTAVKALSKRIEEQKGTYQAELRKEEQELRQADEELSRQRSVLSAGAYAQKREELEQRVATLQREAQKRKKSLDQQFSNGMGRIQNELAKVAQEIAVERGLDLILSKATVVIVRHKFEITDEAIRRLNARLPNAPPTQIQN